MRFGPVLVQEALGGLLAHTLHLDTGVLRKGMRLEEKHLHELREGGIDRVTVAHLGPEDVAENDAAQRLATAASGAALDVRPPFTGRANIRAEQHGILIVDSERVREANRVDEGLTLATLPGYSRVAPRDLVATAKIVPLAVAAPDLEAAVAALATPTPALSVAPFREHRIALLLTTLPGSSERLRDKAEAVTRARVEAVGSDLAVVRTVAHDSQKVATELRAAIDAGCSLVLVLGASAIVDRADVVPQALVDEGGTVHRLGIPVDPGNLLLIGSLGEVPVLGMPGCARSPRPSGFDTVFERLLAGLDPSAEELASLAVGGLLKEIPTRPQPRSGPDPEGLRVVGGPGDLPVVEALVLAAGHSRRMGEANKLLQEIDGVPMVVGIVDRLRASGLDRITVVTGYDAESVEAALADRAVEFQHNPDHTHGLSTSLRTGVASVEARSHGVLVCLGDMPRVRPDTLHALLNAFGPTRGNGICVPVHGGKRGNPVLWGSAHFARLREVEGDVGAKGLFAELAPDVHEIEVDDPGILLDIDTREALTRLREGDQNAPRR